MIQEIRGLEDRVKKTCVDCRSLMIITSSCLSKTRVAAAGRYNVHIKQSEQKLNKNCNRKLKFSVKVKEYIC